MAVELNEDGTIASNPLWSWDVGTIADVGVFVRLELATKKDEPDREPIVVQLTMSAEQLDGLIGDLENTRAALLNPPTDKTAQ